MLCKQLFCSGNDKKKSEHVQYRHNHRRPIQAVYVSNKVTFLKTFSIQGWLNPWIRNPWIWRIHCIFLGSFSVESLSYQPSLPHLKNENKQTKKTHLRISKTIYNTFDLHLNAQHRGLYHTNNVGIDKCEITVWSQAPSQSRIACRAFALKIKF